MTWLHELYKHICPRVKKSALVCAHMHSHMHRHTYMHCFSIVALWGAGGEALEKCSLQTHRALQSSRIGEGSRELLPCVCQAGEGE